MQTHRLLHTKFNCINSLIEEVKDFTQAFNRALGLKLNSGVKLLCKLVERQEEDGDREVCAVDKETQNGVVCERRVETHLAKGNMGI